MQFDDRLRASKVLHEEIANHPEVEVRVGTTVKEFHGNGRLGSVTLQEVATCKTEEITPAGLFIFIVLTPNTGFARDFVELDQWGCIETDRIMEANVPGDVNAGGMRVGSTKQVASAVGGGRDRRPDGQGVIRNDLGQPRLQW